MKPFVAVLEEGALEPTFYKDGKRYAFEDIKEEDIYIAQMARDRYDR